MRSHTSDGSADAIRPIAAKLYHVPAERAFCPGVVSSAGCSRRAISYTTGTSRRRRSWYLTSRDAAKSLNKVIEPP